MSKKSPYPLISLVWAGTSRLDPKGVAKSMLFSDGAGRQHALAATAWLSGLSAISILAHQAPASANPTTALLSTGSAASKTTSRSGVDLVVALGGKITIEEIRLLVPGASRLLLDGQEFALISSHQNSTQALAKGRQLQFTLPWPLEILVYQKPVSSPNWSIVNNPSKPNIAQQSPALVSNAGSIPSAAQLNRIAAGPTPAPTTQQRTPSSSQQSQTQSRPSAQSAAPTNIVPAVPAAERPQKPELATPKPQIAAAGATITVPEPKAEQQTQGLAEATDLVASASLASDIPQPLPLTAQTPASLKPAEIFNDAESRSSAKPKDVSQTSSKIVSPIASEKASQSSPGTQPSKPPAHASTAIATSQSEQAADTVATATSPANIVAALRSDLNYLLVSANDTETLARLSAYTTPSTFITISGVKYVQVGVYSASRVGNYLLRQKMFQLTQAGFSPRTVAGASIPA